MKYSILNKTHANLHIIQLDEGEFAGCQIIYGAVGIEESNGEARIKFDYNIVNNYTVSKDRMKDFVTALGDTLTSIIDEQMDNNETVYTGGA